METIVDSMERLNMSDYLLLAINDLSRIWKKKKFFWFVSWRPKKLRKKKKSFIPSYDQVFNVYYSTQGVVQVQPMDSPLSPAEATYPTPSPSQLPMDDHTKNTHTHPSEETTTIIPEHKPYTPPISSHTSLEIRLPSFSNGRPVGVGLCRLQQQQQQSRARDSLRTKNWNKRRMSAWEVYIGERGFETSTLPALRLNHNITCSTFFLCRISIRTIRYLSQIWYAFGTR